MPSRRDPVCEHGWQRAACPHCRGRRSAKSGRATQTEMHKELGGTGVSPRHEESGRGYEIETLRVHPEAKGGRQIPQSLVKFIDTDWYRRAISQSSRSLPVGSGAKPALWCHLPGGRKVLIVDFGGGRGKADAKGKGEDA